MPEAAAEGHHPCRDAKTHKVPITAGEHRQVHWYHRVDMYLYANTNILHICIIIAHAHIQSFSTHSYSKDAHTKNLHAQVHISWRHCCISLFAWTNICNRFTHMHACKLPHFNAASNPSVCSATSVCMV